MSQITAVAKRITARLKYARTPVFLPKTPQICWSKGAPLNKRLENKIIQCNSMNLSECWYLLPAIFYNIPLYNRDGCKVYLKNKLNEDRFLVYFTGDDNNIIYVSWKK